MKNQRQKEIVRLLCENRILKANVLAQRFHVSMETIRRDFEYLEKKGYLTRTYGGAVAKSMRGSEPKYLSRIAEHSKEKQAIGRCAAQLIEEGDTLIIDSGTTTLALARQLSNIQNLTVFTNSVPIATELIKNPGIKVILLGGNLRNGGLSTSGFLAENSIKLFHADKAFLGAGGVTLAYGVGDYHVEEANLKRHYAEHAQKVILLADHSKFGVIALNHICSCTKIDIIVTDSNVDEKLASELKRKGPQIITAAL